jgi:hypothetical protein
LPDGYIHSEFDERCKQSAAALRVMQARLVLSDDTTFGELTKEMNEFIFAIATGNYGMMPTCELPSANRFRKISSVLKDLVIAAIPLTAVIGACYLGIRFTGSFGNWIVVVALLWLIISVISILDPLYSSKINALNNVVSIVLRRGQ